MINSTEILQSLDDLNKRTTKLLSQSDALSLKAVEGDILAISELAEVQAKLKQALNDAETLRAAYRAAVEREGAHSAEEWEARREELLTDAKQSARKVIAVAKAVDQIAEDFRRLLEEGATAETELWRLLREAHEEVSDGVVGRRGIAEICRQVIQTCDRPPAFRRKPAHEVASYAWQMFADGSAAHE